jgi:hypothetical protein
MRSNRHSASKIWPKQWTDIVLKLSSGHCPLGPDFIHWEVSRISKCKSDIIWVKSDIVRWDQTLSGRRSLENTIFSQNLSLSSQTWFLSYRAPNQMKHGHKGYGICPHYFNGWLGRETGYGLMDRPSVVLWIGSGALFSQEQWPCSTLMTTMQKVAIRRLRGIRKVGDHTRTKRGKCVACWSDFPLQGVHRSKSS